MYKFSEIEKLLKYKILPLKEIEIVNINNAMGRFLAENIYAKINIPPANNSAVDGYLFRHKTITSEPASKNFNAFSKKSSVIENRSFMRMGVFCIAFFCTNFH